MIDNTIRIPIISDVWDTVTGIGALALGAYAAVVQAPAAIKKFLRETGNFLGRVLLWLRSLPPAVLEPLMRWLANLAAVFPAFAGPLQSLIKVLGAPQTSNGGPELSQQMDQWFSENNVVDAQGVKDALGGLTKGRNKGVREVPTDADVQRLYDELSKNGTPWPRPRYDGPRVKLPDGTEIGIRGTSRSDGKTLDVKYPDGKEVKVHIP